MTQSITQYLETGTTTRTCPSIVRVSTQPLQEIMVYFANGKSHLIDISSEDIDYISVSHRDGKMSFEIRTSIEGGHFQRYEGK